MELKTIENDSKPLKTTTNNLEPLRATENQGLNCFQFFPVVFSDFSCFLVVLRGSQLF